MIIKIPRAYIEAMPANLIEGKVKLTFSLPLNAETMKLREQIAMLKVLDTAVVLDITSPQGSLDEVPPPDSPRNITEDGYGETLNPETGEVTSASGTFGAQVFDRMIDDLEANKDAPAPRGHKGRGGTVTISSGPKSVTLTNEQFSKAANRIEQESRAADAHRKKTKNKR